MEFILFVMTLHLFHHQKICTWAIVTKHRQWEAFSVGMKPPRFDFFVSHLACERILKLNSVFQSKLSCGSSTLSEHPSAFFWRRVFKLYHTISCKKVMCCYPLQAEEIRSNSTRNNAAGFCFAQLKHTSNFAVRDHYSEKLTQIQT